MCLACAQYVEEIQIQEMENGWRGTLPGSWACLKGSSDVFAKQRITCSSSWIFILQKLLCLVISNLTTRFNDYRLNDWHLLLVSYFVSKASGMLAHWICPECPSHLRFVFGERCGNEIPCLQDSQGRPLEFQIMRTSTISTEFLIVFEYSWLPKKPVCSILFWTLATLRTSRHNRWSTWNLCKLIFVSFLFSCG